MTIFLIKNQRTLFWGHFGLFFPNLDKNEFSLEKRTLSVFKYFNYLPSCKKSEKTNETFLKEMTDGRTDGWTDGGTHDSDFIGPFIERGCKKGEK